jgi:hypothetical protein
MLFITNIPESAEVTKKIRMINITKNLQWKRMAYIPET